MSVFNPSNGRERLAVVRGEQAFQTVPREGAGRHLRNLALGGIAIGITLLVVRLVMALIVAEDLRRKADATKEAALAEAQRSREEAMAESQAKLEQAEQKRVAAAQKESE